MICQVTFKQFPILFWCIYKRWVLGVGIPSPVSECVSSPLQVSPLADRQKKYAGTVKAMCVTLLSFNPVSLSFLDLGGDPPTCTIIRRMPSYRENKNYIILFFTIGSLGTFYQSLSCTNTRTRGHRAKVFLSCHRSTWRNTLSKLIHRFFKV